MVYNCGKRLHRSQYKSGNMQKKHQSQETKNRTETRERNSAKLRTESAIGTIEQTKETSNPILSHHCRWASSWRQSQVEVHHNRQSLLRLQTFSICRRYCEPPWPKEHHAGSLRECASSSALHPSIHRNESELGSKARFPTRQREIMRR